MRGMLVLLALGVPVAARAQLRGIPFDVRVPKAPAVATVDGKNYFIYELRITNLGPTEYQLEKVEVSAAGAPLAAWEGDSLKAITTRIGESTRGADGRVLPGGRQALLFLYVTTPAGPAPKTFLHRIAVAHADSAKGTVHDTLNAFPVEVDARSVVVVRPPFKDGPWVAVNGPGNTSGHRRAAIAVEGQSRISQRFATDWIKLGPDGRAFQGDSSKNDAWYGYRMPLLAAGSGVVVEVKDNIPENVPFSPVRAVPITLETIGGNHVIIDLGQGRYAFYAHMVPGSLKVKLGDKVSTGQVLGLLGNSGNSTAPHLHFHVSDAPSPLGSEGVPFLFDEYEKLGQATARGLTGQWTASAPAETHRKELPLQNQIVRFAR
ncbi:MAG: M23 family metallopeptidase [Gemmatimonadota bacterium]